MAGRRSLQGPASVVLIALTFGGLAAISVPKAAASVASIVSVGASHACVLTPDGGVECWGGNRYGQLGDGTVTRRLIPVGVVGLTSGVVAISAGGWQSCAITTTGGAKCWGHNEDGQLGDGTTRTRSTPVDVVGLASGIAEVTSGAGHTCALTITGGVKCWGDNSHGELGDGTRMDRPTPVDVVGLSSGVTEVSAGQDHTCALMAEGGARCWGANRYGQLGDGTTTRRLTPVDVAGLTTGVAQVLAAADYNAGGGFSCALSTDGGVKCWGYNYFGELGDGTTKFRHAPVNVVGLASDVTQISGGGHVCALTGGGGVKCWGYNHQGEIGDGSTTDRLAPVDVVGLASGVVQLSAGGSTCARMSSGGVKCWGYNSRGQIGDGTRRDRYVPVTVWGFEGSDPSVYRPDSQIAKSRTGPWRGDGVYDLTGLGQTERTRVAPRGTAEFFVRVENDGGTADVVFLCAIESGSDQVDVGYSADGSLVTKQIRHGVYYRLLAPGESVSIRVKMIARRGAVSGARQEVLIRVESAGNSQERDVVRAVGTVK